MDTAPSWGDSPLEDPFQPSPLSSMDPLRASTPLDSKAHTTDAAPGGDADEGEEEDFVYPGASEGALRPVDSGLDHQSHPNYRRRTCHGRCH